MKKKFNILRGLIMTLSVTISVMVLDGCASTKGVVNDDRYTSPHRNFSCALPPMLRPVNVKDMVGKDTRGFSEGGVDFSGYLGSPFRVDWLELGPKLLQEVSVNEAEEERFVLGAFTNYLQGFQRLNQKAAVEVVEKRIMPNGEAAVFASIWAPGAGRSHGVLTFRHGNWLYGIATIVDMKSSPPQNRETTTEERIAKLKRKLDAFYTGFEFK